MAYEFCHTHWLTESNYDNSIGFYYVNLTDTKSWNGF